MPEIAQFETGEIVQALAATLLHFLWQGAIAAVVAAVLMRVTDAAATRYAIGICALVAMLAAPIATFVALISAPPGLVESAVGGLATGSVNIVAAASALTQVESSAASPGWWSAAGVFAWFAGMVILSIRLAGGWFVARRMATDAVRPAAAHVQAVAIELAGRLALRRVVQVLESSAVAVPVLVGWLRPTVIFPVAALAGLSPIQIEALLAHELAHVRRNDYLVNLLQSFAEVVLFYHPAVWWLSRRIRTERELCCDDLAVGICDRLVYATALTDLAAMRSPRIALAATGGDLLTRVRRILGNEEPSMSLKSRWIPAVVVSGLVIATVPVLLASVRSAAPHQQPPSSVEVAAIAPLVEPESPAMADESEQAAPNRIREEIRLKEILARLLSEEQSVDVERLTKVQGLVEERARQAELNAARAAVARAQRLFEVGLTTPAQLEEAKAALAMIEAGDDQKQREAIEIELAKSRLADAKKRFEVGLVTQDELARRELELARAQRRGSLEADVDREMADRLRQFERSRVLFEKGLVSKGQLAALEETIARELQNQKSRLSEFEGKAADQKEIEKMVKDLMVELEKKSAAVNEDATRVRELQARTRERRDVLREIFPEPLKTNQSLEAIPSRPIIAGDTLFIAIEGESQLPTIYRIEGNGSIRVPLLGSFKVIGQTPGQVREAIGKRLIDAKLGTPAKVRVELRRPRGER